MFVRCHRLMYGAARRALLHLAVESPARLVVGRVRRFVDQAIDLRIAEVAAIEAGGRHLLRVKDAAQDVGIGQGAADPLQRVHLKVALEDVRIQRGELVRAHVDVDADVAQILLDDRRLQPGEFQAGRLERQRQTRPRAVAVGIGIAGLVEERFRALRIVVEARRRPARAPSWWAAACCRRRWRGRGAGGRRWPGDRSRSRWRAARGRPSGSDRAG